MTTQIKEKCRNIILSTDSYKVTHWQQYRPGTSHVFSFFESRGGRFPKITFFGLQYILKRYLTGEVVTSESIDEARDVFSRHFGNPELFNEQGWRHILKRHGGRLPIRILAIPEGTTVPVHNVLMTVENTDSQVPWLTNYMETLLCQVWYPITVCTQSREMRKLILMSLQRTGDPGEVDFKLHDFGFRGSTSIESAGIGGVAHLVNFKGTDTMEALVIARDYYQEPMAGFSIPAAEHSTITSWGKNNESSAFENMLTSFPTGSVAVVSDSYDIFNACLKIWGSELKDKVLQRDGVLIVRPDSGDPPSVVVKVLNILGESFGFTINNKGFKVLNPKVRVIQGDGIDYAMLEKILSAIEVEKWSADNLAFGSGGGLLQNVNRDTQKFAFKCSAICVNKIWRNVFKNPITDSSKKSKAGRLVLIKSGHAYSTVRDENTTEKNLLVPVFENGKLLKDYSLSEIRTRANLI